MKTKQITYDFTESIKRVICVTVAILMFPLLGMLLTEQWNWGILDFTLIGLLIFVTGIAIELARHNLKQEYRSVAIITIIAICFLIWTELAVGLISKLLTGELWIFDVLN